MMEKKSENNIRCEIKMSEMEVKEKSDRICQNIISSNLFQQAEKMLVYAPLGNEVDICPVMEEGWRGSRNGLLSRKYLEKQCDILKSASFSQLEEGTFSCDAELVETNPIDWEEVVLVPE